jgi:hypothetical protein
MRLRDDLPRLLALLLALATAVMSSGPTVRETTSAFLAAVFTPQVADLGEDPEYSLGTVNSAAPWLPPPPR